MTDTEAGEITGHEGRTNANIVRWARGTYVYRGLSDGRPRGREHFHLTVHPDGTRLMRAFTDIYERDVQLNALLRVEASFRPLEAYVSLYTQGRFKGSALFHVEGDRLRALAHDTTGHTDRTIDVPPIFSIGCHPIAMDGWHSWPVQPILDTPQETKIYFINGSPIWSRPLLGTLQTHHFIYRGEEDVAVPAGRFACSHVTLSGHSEMWVSGDDRRLIRYDWTKLDRRYELETLEAG